MPRNDFVALPCGRTSATGLLFYAVVWKFGVTPETVKRLILVSLLEMLFWTDLETRLLPDVLTLGGLAAALCLALAVPGAGGLRGALLGAVLLSVPLWAIAKADARLRRIEPPGLRGHQTAGAVGSFFGCSGGLAGAADRFPDGFDFRAGLYSGNWEESQNARSALWQFPVRGRSDRHLFRGRTGPFVAGRRDVKRAVYLV